MYKIVLLAAFGCSSLAAFSQSDSAQVYLAKGLDEQQKAHKLEALKNFEKAYSFDAQSKDVVKQLAASYLDLRRYPQAVAKFKELEKLGDQSEDTYRQLMVLSHNMRQYDDVIRYASLLKHVVPAEPTALYLAKAFYGKEDLGNAIKYFEFAAKENPDNADIPYTEARAYADMFNYKAAIPYFQKAIALQPDNNRWIYEMALIYYAIPDDQNALKYMLLAGEKGLKKDNEYMQNLATAYLNAGKLDEGIGILKEMLAKRPSDINILNSLAEAYYDSKKFDDAINTYDELLRIDTTNAEALYMIGMCFQKKGDKEKGMALCDKAISMNPSLQSLKHEKQMPGGL